MTNNSDRFSKYMNIIQYTYTPIFIFFNLPRDQILL